MSRSKDRFSGMNKSRMAVVASALSLAAAGAAPAGQAAASPSPQGQVATTQSKFYCNINALTPAERARHKQLSDKLNAARKDIVESDKGYEFQFSPADVTLAELADWVREEGKCCPFFDFHIDLENQGTLLCLRLTGEEGVKQFIRTEFLLAAK